MFSESEALIAEFASPSEDIDWDLLLLLARVEASVRWGDFSPLDGVTEEDRKNA